jgi:hypothetical protein
MKKYNKSKNPVKKMIIDESQFKRLAACIKNESKTKINK